MLYVYKDCDTRGRALQTPFLGRETQKLSSAEVVAASAASIRRRVNHCLVQCVVDVVAVTDIAQHCRCDSELQPSARWSLVAS